MSNAEIRGLFVWHELMTTDPQGAATFYAGLFRWQAHPSSVPGYTLWMSGEVGVGGLMSQPEEASLTAVPPSWLVYLGTPDVDATIQAALRLGGRVLKEPADIPAIGRFAVLADPQGAAFSIFTPAVPAPEGAAASGVISQFSWHELATFDLQGALDFYLPLFGWSRGAAHDLSTGNTYQIIEREGTPIGGIYRLQDPSKPPHWLTYVNVDDLDTIVSAVRVTGGQIVQEPREVPGGDRVAWILDPQGGAIALHEVRKVISAPSDEPLQARKRLARRRRPTPHRRSGQRTSKRTAARTGGAMTGTAKVKTKSKATVRAKAKAQPKAKATMKAKSRKKPVKSRALARKRPAKRAAAKVPARGRAKLTRPAAKKSRPAAKTTRKHKVAKRAKRKTTRRR